MTQFDIVGKYSTVPHNLQESLLRRVPVNLPFMPWYHGKINREESEALLKKKIDGKFLIRESHNFPGHFTLSLCYSDDIQHYRIIYENSKYTIDECIEFDSLSDLVSHYAEDPDGLVHNLVDYVTCQSAIFPPVIINFEKAGWFIPFNSLEFQEKIGSGEFASVYRANISVEVVAAKKIKKLSQLSYHGLKEAAFMTFLNHGNLVSFYGISEDIENVYFISEFMPNGCLLDYLRSIDQKKVNNTKLLSLTIDVATGMEHISSLNLVHRDLAARNILLDKNYRAKIADFGLCRDVRTSDKTGRFPIKWTAPESIETKSFTLKSDIWSFGVLMWEIFSLGRQPYVGMAVKDVLSYLKEGLRLEKPASCPAACYELMLKTWDKDTKQRPDFKMILNILNEMFYQVSQSQHPKMPKRPVFSYQPSK